MEKKDYIYGMNYIDQLQYGCARRFLRVESILAHGPRKPIDAAFGWATTPQGHAVWNKRERIFDLFYGIPLINLVQLPRDAVSVDNEPLLVGIAPTSREADEADDSSPLF